MVEPTRVPLQPIKKGSLTKLWLGIVVVVLVAVGFAWWAAPHGIKLTVLTEGKGPHPTKEDVVFVDYIGKLPNGTVFDQSRSLNIPIPGILPEGYPLPASGNIPGFDEGLQKMQAGGKYELYIPAEKAYGAKPPPGPIPPNSDLMFEVTVHAIMPEAEAEQRFRMIQQMMQQSQGAQGSAPGGAAPQESAPAPNGGQ